MTSAGSWYTFAAPNGYNKKFQPSKWAELMVNDAEFKKHVYEVFDTEMVQKFDKREGNASSFYADPEDLTVPVKD